MINVIEIMMGVIFYVYFSLCINKVHNCSTSSDAVPRTVGAF